MLGQQPCKDTHHQCFVKNSSVGLVKHPCRQKPLTPTTWVQSLGRKWWKERRAPQSCPQTSTCTGAVCASPAMHAQNKWMWRRNVWWWWCFYLPEAGERDQQLGALAALQKAGIWLPAPMSGSSQPLITPGSGHPTPSPVFHRHPCTHVHTHIHTSTCKQE